MTALYVRFHRWHGFSLFNSEPDLFSYVFKLGFCTLYVCKTCLLGTIRKLRATISEAISKSEEGR